MNYYIDDLLPSFLSTDDLRPAIMQPHVAGDKIVATDAHTLIVAPKTYFVAPPQPNDLKFPNYQAVIPSYDKPLYDIALSDFKAKYDAIPKVDIYEDCKECNGEGEVECPECNYNHECESCDGKGEGEKVIGRQPAAENSLSINGISYIPYLFKRIADVVERLKLDRITIYAGSETKATVILTNDILMLIMPCKNEFTKHIIPFKPYENNKDKTNHLCREGD